MTKPEPVSPQAVAEAAANHIVAAVAAHLAERVKPAAGGDVRARECLSFYGELTKLDAKRMATEHFQPIADAICDEFDMRGGVCSFVAPTWGRDGTTILGDHVASVGADGPVVRVVVFSAANHLDRMAVLWSVRFAGV